MRERTIFPRISDGEVCCSYGSSGDDVMTDASSRSMESLVYSPSNDETTRVTAANHECHTDHGGGEMDYMMPGKRITTVVGFAIIEGFTNTCSLLEEHACTYINTIAHIVHQVGWQA